jgi:hypothetical protein
VGTDTELVEKLGRNDPCQCESGRRFPPLLPQRGRFDGPPAAYYVQDRKPVRNDFRQVSRRG